MVGRLISLSLRHRGLVLGAAAVLLVVGAYRATQLPVDVFPDLTAPRVTIVTEATGLAAEEIEQLVTFPLESAVNGAAGVRRVRSASAPGISLVWVEFDWSTSGNQARQRVAERLQGLGDALPPEASAPALAPASSVMGEIAFVAVTSSKVGPRELRRVAEVEVRRRLLAVEGVSQVVAIGGEEKLYEIALDAPRLERAQLTAGDVVSAVERGSRNAPGGYLVEGGQESVVRVLGRAHTRGDLEAIVVAVRGGAPVRVVDVADVGVASAVRRGAASYNASPAVILSVVKQPEADTLSTTRRLDVALDSLEPALAKGGVELHRDIFRQTDFIETSIANLLEVLRDGAVLVVAVLFFFLWSARPTIISALAIPLSLVLALLALDLAGLRIDTMTLGGLAIAIGELVDDAIVDVENVARRLRERAALPEAERPPLRQTVLSASLEVRSSIVSATYIIMLVFVPLLFLEGLEGRLLRPLAISYLVAIFGSLLVAVTVTPVLAGWLLPRGAERRHAEPPVMRWLGARYQPLLERCLRYPRAVAGGAALVVVGGVVGLLGLGRAFLPEFNEGSVNIAMVLAPGTALADSDALATMAERALLADPAVAAIGRRTGRAERDEHVLGVETSELEVRLDPADPRSKSQLFADLRERLRVVPGAQFTLGQPISHRNEHMISGQRAGLTVHIYGQDLRMLRRAAVEIEAIARETPGLVDVAAETIVDIPQVVVRVDPPRAAAHGLSPGEAAGAISTALWGATPGHIYEDSTATDIVVRQVDVGRLDLPALERLTIPTPAGQLVPISALAEVRRDVGPNYVLRDQVERRIAVTANIEGRDSHSVVESLRERVAAQAHLAPGYRVEYAGQFEREAAAGRRLLFLGAFAVLGIAIIVALTLRSARRAIIVLVNLPLALAGGVIGVYVAGGVLSVATTIGFITLFGIATRNGILLATRAGDLEADGEPREAAVARAARERLAPILMTAVTAALGLLPLALAIGRPGSEIQAPMALVILFGLVTSTLLNMLVVPALLSRWGGPALPTSENGAMLQSCMAPGER